MGWAPNHGRNDGRAKANKLVRATARRRSGQGFDAVSLAAWGPAKQTNNADDACVQDSSMGKLNSPALTLPFLPGKGPGKRSGKDVQGGASHGTSGEGISHPPHSSLYSSDQSRDRRASLEPLINPGNSQALPICALDKRMKIASPGLPRYR